MDPLRQMMVLVGKTLYTLRQHRAFDVVAVHPDRDAAVVIRVHSTGKTRTISRSEIESGYELVLQRQLALKSFALRLKVAGWKAGNDQSARLAKNLQRQSDFVILARL